MLQEFKTFIMKGNLVEIAVGLIIALKFADVIKSLQDNIIGPIIGGILGVPKFADKTLSIGKGVLKYGSFIDSLIAFVITGFVLFLIVKAYNGAKAKFETTPEAAEDVPDDIILLREIRDALQAQGGTR
ncbi:MAG: large conductance mechanosensitive channel protein MscL [Aquihabitans sp.]